MNRQAKGRARRLEARLNPNPYHTKTVASRRLNNKNMYRAVPQVLACILDGLADEAEGVRDAALAAGRISVELYANSALPLLLPAVEAAIMSANWWGVALFGGGVLPKVGARAGAYSMLCGGGAAAAAALHLVLAVGAGCCACCPGGPPEPFHLRCCATQNLKGRTAAAHSTAGASASPRLSCLVTCCSRCGRPVLRRCAAAAAFLPLVVLVRCCALLRLAAGRRVDQSSVCRARPRNQPGCTWRAPRGTSSRTPQSNTNRITIGPQLTNRITIGPQLVWPQVAGTTGRIQQDLHNEEEEGISAEAHGQAIVEALGLEK